jgi:hypothetical protein
MVAPDRLVDRDQHHVGWNLHIGRHRRNPAGDFIRAVAADRFDDDTRAVVKSPPPCR